MKKLNECIVFLLFAVFGQATLAQGMVILGDNAYAKQCHQAAETAAITRIVSDQNMASCNAALDYGSLKMRDRAATFVNRGILHSASEAYQKAATDYDRAEAIGGPSAEIYANKGNLLFVQKDYQAAIEHYDLAIAAGLARVHVAYANRGMVREALTQLDQAKADYQAALEISPEWIKVKQLLARVDLKLSKRTAQQ